MPRFDSDLDYYQWHHGCSEYVPNPANLRGVPIYPSITHRDPGDENDATPDPLSIDTRDYRLLRPDTEGRR